MGCIASIPDDQRENTRHMEEYPEAVKEYDPDRLVRKPSIKLISKFDRFDDEGSVSDYGGYNFGSGVYPYAAECHLEAHGGHKPPRRGISFRGEHCDVAGGLNKSYSNVAGSSLILLKQDSHSSGSYEDSMDSPTPRKRKQVQLPIPSVVL